MAYAPTVQAEAGFTENSVRHYGSALTEPRTDSLSHADVYSGLQAVIAILAALNSRRKSGKGQYIDVAMAATLLAVNERAHVDLSDDDIGAEPAVLGARSEEHTSELQSLRHLVCRLLLEKKKNEQQFQQLMHSCTAPMSCEGRSSTTSSLCK